MANSTFLGVEATKVAATVPSLIEEGKYGGKLRVMYDTYVLTADLASGDIIKIGSPLPEGAILLNCKVKTGALGGSCTINVGCQASPLDETTHAALEAAVPTLFFAALPVSSATSASAYGSTYEGVFYARRLLAPVQVVVAENAVSVGATGLSISVEVHYIVD